MILANMNDRRFFANHSFSFASFLLICNHMQSYESIIYNDNLDTSIEKMLQFVDGRRLNDEFDIERFQREIDEIIWKLK